MMQPLSLVLLAAFVCVGSAAPSDEYLVHAVEPDAPLPRLTVSGTHYGVGHAVGVSFADRIQKFVASYDNLADVLLPFYETAAGKEAVDSLTAANKAHYPQYFEEIRGMADGANVTFLKLLLLNFEDEIDGLTSNSSTAGREHCTDVHISGSSVWGFGHNEDNDPTICTFTYLVNFTVYSDSEWERLRTDGVARAEAQFTAYCYPGYLPGVAYGWNSYGFTFSENAVFPDAVNVHGLGDNFVGRSLYETSSWNDMLERFGKDRAYGFSWNLGATLQRQGPWAANIEVAGSLPLNTYNVSFRGNYSHENMLRRIETPQQTSESSVHRLAVINSRPAVQVMTDIAKLLGDTSDPQYPIYRDAHAPDDCSTCSTVLFDLGRQTASIYVTNPRTGTPLYVYPLV